MNEQLTLHVPRLDELSYRQKLMADPETMRYNSGYDMDFPGYHRDTGCIDFPESDWADWHAYFVGQEPERFYAYVMRETDGAFIGEVNVHRAPGEDVYDMGIVIEARYRGRGYAVPALELLLRHAFEEMGARAVRNDFEETRAAALRAHLACGFERVGCENGIVRVRITREQYMRGQAIRRMAGEIADILPGASIYLYGSWVEGDFRPRWSDVDLLVLTGTPIAQAQAEALLMLRQRLVERTGDDFYRAFEGGMIDLDAFLRGTPTRVVYWGTSGQRIKERHDFDSFNIKQLMERGRLLRGEDVRGRMNCPDAGALRADVRRVYAGIRTCAQRMDRSVYAFGWLLDIARCLYTLRTGEIIAKTAAGQWALDEGICPVPEAMETALRVRREPERLAHDKEMMDAAQAMGPKVQRFADVLEQVLNES